MAINDTTTNTQSTASAQPTGQAAQPQQAQPQAQASRWSFHNTGAFNRAPIGRGIGSEALTNLKEVLFEEFKLADNVYEMSLITIDRTNEIKLDFSAIVVCLRDKNDLKAGVGYHTLVVEGTGDEISSHFENQGGRQIEIIHPTSDAADVTMNQIVYDKVRTAFGTIPMFMADFCVVPRTFDTKDKVAVHNLAVNAGLAAMTELATHQRGFEDLNFAKFAKDSTLKADLVFGREQIEDYVGLPMRSDIRVTLTSKQNNAAGQQNTQVAINSGDRVTKISTLGGFVDLVYVPPFGQQNFNMYQQPGMGNPYGMQQQVAPQTQMYLPRLVITNFESTFLSSYASQLLSILTSFSLRNDNNWIQAFKPMAQAGGRVDMHDIGGVGYEMNIEGNPTGFGNRIDTSANSFTTTNLGQLIAATISPDLVISLDVPEAGTQTWYSAVFASAASGENQSAYNAIIAAANQLTNGIFQQNFQAGSPIFVGNQERVHLGYYTDENGVKRDLRDIDYLAVLNLAGANNEPAAIKLWSDTYTLTNVPIQIRLADRKKIIQNLKPSAVFTGFANRVTFSQLFLDALVASCNAVGVQMAVATPMNTGDFSSERGTGSFLQGARLSNNIGGVFNRGFANNNGGNMGGQYNQFQRWN